jgi:hypothetical protein
MIEISSVASALRHRRSTDTHRQGIERRAEINEQSLKAFNEVKNRTHIIDEQVLRQAHRVRNRRNNLEFELSSAQNLSEQQQALDNIRSDELFQRGQDKNLANINSVRDSDIESEERLVGVLTAHRHDATQRDADAQRAEDLRLTLSNRDDRLAERRIADQNAEVVRQVDLHASIDRIAKAKELPLRPQNADLGNILDVRA